MPGSPVWKYKSISTLLMEDTADYIVNLSYRIGGGVYGISPSERGSKTGTRKCISSHYRIDEIWCKTMICPMSPTERPMPRLMQEQRSSYFSWNNNIDTSRQSQHRDLRQTRVCLLNMSIYWYIPSLTTGPRLSCKQPIHAHVLSDPVMVHRPIERRGLNLSLF